jgi:hypothetical protein
VAYPDAVALVVAYLGPLHTGKTVASRVPSPRPDEWIEVRQVGGAWDPPVREQVRLDVFYWALTEPAAQTGAEAVRREIHSLASTSTLGVQCYRVDELMGPRQWDDPLTPNTFARWATYTLTLRADDAVTYH